MAKSESPAKINVCGIFHDVGANPRDTSGCILNAGHQGPHEFIAEGCEHYLWETDWECECDDCMKCDGDYCTTYWKKPAPKATVVKVWAGTGEMRDCLMSDGSVQSRLLSDARAGVQ